VNTVELSEIGIESSNILIQIPLNAYRVLNNVKYFVMVISAHDGQVLGEVPKRDTVALQVGGGAWG
jgi:hypothetical protein